MQLSEKETREQLIDKALDRVGWKVKGSYIKEEVNSIKSNFRTKDYILSEGNGDDSGRFIDYLLLAEDFSPIALIEAKKFSVNQDKGRSQARTYSRDIEEQLGYKIPHFLTNGQKWLFIDQDGVEREISYPFSQSVLNRRLELYKNRKDPTKLNISKIVDRPRNVLIVKKILEHLQKGYRSGLISMATGTGKTRVAVAIIEVLLKARVIRNALFIADRIALVNQAKSTGFKEFLSSEAIVDLRDSPTSFPDGLYVSTLQTLKSGKKKKVFEKFNSGFFDLIIFDEAHRSIYDPNRVIFNYFDAIKIGLTATPSSEENKNTFELFNCLGNKPTVEYSYDEAVEDGILVPYTALMIDTRVLSLGIEGTQLTKELQTQLIKQEEDPKFMVLPGASFARIFMDDKTNELIVREFMELCYKSDDGKPAKTIFFCANVKHAKHLKRLFNKLYPNLGNDVQEIISENYRYTDELARFKLDSEPRIALSVGVLDTGVDIPEVCNLVFVKPVFSAIRFWQMLGRGTRNQQACKHTEWLPNSEKNDFLIMDFAIGGYSNIKEHHLKKVTEKKAGTDAMTRLFLNNVNLLRKNMDNHQREFIENKIIEEVDSLDKESFIVREKLTIIKKVVSKKFNLKDHIEELKTEIAPLISLNPGKNPKVVSCILKLQKLFEYILEEDGEGIFSTYAYIKEKLENILQKSNLEIIQKNKDIIIGTLDELHWENLTFDDVERMIKEISPLMIYYEPNPKRVLQVDAPDLVLKIQKFKKDIKKDKILKEFLESNQFIKKIKLGEGITSEELVKLEKELIRLRPGISIDNIQRIENIDFILFLRKIVGLGQQYDPKVLIEREFDKHIIEQNQNYNSDQIKFLQFLKKVFVMKKYLELRDFTVPPLSNERPTEKFKPSELDYIVQECKKIRFK